MLAARAGLVSRLPLMHRTFYIRLARVEEAAALSDLCFRSKAVWGYDPSFMMLMPAALEVAGEDITAGDVWVATGADGQIAGVLALAPGDEPGALDLNKLTSTIGHRARMDIVENRRALAAGASELSTVTLSRSDAKFGPGKPPPLGNGSAVGACAIGLRRSDLRHSITSLRRDRVRYSY